MCAEKRRAPCSFSCPFPPRLLPRRRGPERFRNASVCARGSCLRPQRVWEPQAVLCPRTRHQRCPQDLCRAFERGGNRQDAAGRCFEPLLPASPLSLPAPGSQCWCLFGAQLLGLAFFSPLFFFFFIYFFSRSLFFSHIHNLKKTTAPNLHCYGQLLCLLRPSAADLLCMPFCRGTFHLYH